MKSKNKLENWMPPSQPYPPQPPTLIYYLNFLFGSEECVGL